MGVFGPFDSVEAYRENAGEPLPRLVGVLSGDAFYRLQFRSELPDGSFWSFDGYAVVRTGCVIHMGITQYDN